MPILELQGKMPAIIYDGSFFGLLTAICHGIKKDLACVEIKKRGDFWSDLFSKPEFVETNHQKAEEFLENLTKISLDFKKILLFSYHSEIDGFETSLFNFIWISIKEGRFVKDHTNQNVRFILSATRKVGREIHRFKGFIRFKEMEDKTLFAPFSPDHNIIFFLAQHFIERISKNRWIIFDAKRGLALEWDTRQVFIYEGCEREITQKNFSENEILAQRLWKTYFKEISIQSRKNPRLQRQLMPVRYWKFLTEIS